MNMAVNFDKKRNEPGVAMKFTKAAAETKTLVIDKLVMHKTPQAAEYYLCLEAASVLPAALAWPASDAAQWRAAQSTTNSRETQSARPLQQPLGSPSSSLIAVI